MPEETPDTGERPTLALRAVAYPGSHHLLKACGEEVGWRNAGSPCPTPEWSPGREVPISLTMGEALRVQVAVGAVGAPASPYRPASLDLRGAGPGALRFAEAGIAFRGGAASAELVSSRPIPLRVAKVALDIGWSTGDGAALSPDRSTNIAYVTMDRPRDDQQAIWPEDGVTLKRMDRAVSWVAPLRTRHPHSIVRALMGKFPYYALKPSPKVPREYHHPTYFNEEGGAWPMADHVEESGECQAIVRVVRAVLRQLGIPGDARAVVVWADPDVDQGKRALSAFWDENTSAGLSRTRIVNGQRWIAALSDAPVVVGQEYPASHTILPNGRPSPGLNRYEACLEFTHDGVTRDYGGGAGVFRSRAEVLRAFWGLVWVSGLPDEGFRVEEIVATY